MGHLSIRPTGRLALGAAFAAAGVLLAVGLSDAERTGHYSAKQAAAGATVYSANCSQCHGVRLEGQSGPALTGTTFANYVGKSGTAATLYDFISKQMPADKPGSLTQQQYLDVTAFILSKNGYGPDKNDLTPDALQ